jgi:Family of unknown function (DUF5319)
VNDDGPDAPGDDTPRDGIPDDGPAGEIPGGGGLSGDDDPGGIARDDLSEGEPLDGGLEGEPLGEGLAGGGELGDEAGDGDEGFATPLSDEEREGVEADLEDLDSMRSAFEQQGAKGVVIACTDCGSNHYYGWDLLKESLEHMLDTGEPRMHEPAYQPREDDYVVWDYGKGYVDALADMGLDAEAPIQPNVCAWCETPIDAHFSYCPGCGRQLAALRLYRDLMQRGMQDQEARALLVRAGFEPFIGS